MINIMMDKENLTYSISVSEWIDINLPWECTDSNYIEFPDLSKKEKEVFGISLEESRNKVENFWKDYHKYQYEIDQIINDDDDKLEVKFTEEERIYKEKELWNLYLDKPGVKEIISHKLLIKEIYKWSDEQPEAIEYHIASEKLEKENSKKSFCGLKLNVPGTLIKTKTKIDDEYRYETYLIGDINKLGGFCNDCSIESYAIVMKYCILNIKELT